MLISPLSNEMIQWMIKGYDKTLDNIDHDIHEILSYISPDIAYDDWLYVGMALHAEGYGLSIWEEWSAKGSKYKSGECSQKWNGFDGNGGISIGSLIYIAKQNGYKGKAKGSFNQTPQKTPASPFEFVHVDDLVKNIKPISWLVGGYIENHTLSMIFGDPASGKSFVAIDLSCCIATGTAWHGQDVNQGAVFYIAGEGHNGLGKRFKAWQEHNGVSLENARLHTAKRSAQLYDENSAIAVGDAVQTIIENTGHRPSLIVIDTLARNFGGGDENSTKEMNQFIANVDELKDRWNASVLIIHHSGHQEKARARGSMALKGALDHEYLCKKTGDCLTIENKKTKDGEAPPELSFKFKKTFFQTNEGTTDSAVLVPMENNVRKEIRLNKTQKRALDILRNCMIDKGKY
ncbi:MAG: AAA family ATPase, partial [Bdellovibrionales bacterium]